MSELLGLALVIVAFFIFYEIGKRMWDSPFWWFKYVPLGGAVFAFHSIAFQGPRWWTFTCLCIGALSSIVGLWPHRSKNISGLS